MAKEIKPTMSNDQLDLIYHRLESVFNTLVDMNIDMMRDWLAEGDIKMLIYTLEPMRELSTAMDEINFYLDRK